METLANTLTIGIAFATLAITVIAAISVFVVFGMAKRHNEHIEEIERIRKSYDFAVKRIEDISQRNSILVSENHLAFSIVNNLVNLWAKKRVLSEYFQGKSRFQAQFLGELERIDNELKAREIELRIIFYGGKNISASLDALVNKFGDKKSIDFLSQYSFILKGSGDVDKSTRFDQAIGAISNKIKNHSF